LLRRYVPAVPDADVKLLAAAALVITAAALACPSAHAQLRHTAGVVDFTLEGFANVTAGASFPDRVRDADTARFDAALRGLARLRTDAGVDPGARVVVERDLYGRVTIGEASLLLLGPHGRLEVGRRAGLPDVLVGYGPNNFTFPSAEFGPPSGASLDPGGGLPAAFLAGPARGAVGSLGTLGFSTTLADDRSPKVLYVSPKWHGLLGGASWTDAPRDPRVDRLAQGGLTHDVYRGEDALHWGGSYAYARGRRDAGAMGIRDLHSVNVGASVTLHSTWILGVGATWDGRGGSSRAAGAAIQRRGAVASVNYNRGPWTVGGYAQRAYGAEAFAPYAAQRLDAIEVGASYRFTRQTRLYGGWFHYGLRSDSAGELDRGDVVLVGLRLSL
jgi:hypothetical protein